MDLLVKILIIFVGAPLIGGLVSGIDRKLSARMQKRIGPPLLQPFYDVIKLIRKEPIVVNNVQVIYAYLHLAFMVLTLLLLVMGQDMLMVLFVQAFSSIALILGGMCVRSPYSRIGSQREIMQMVAYEPVLILMVVGIYMVNGSFLASNIVYLGKPLLLSLPLIFIAYLMAMVIKMRKSPFDLSTSHHAHQEIVKGITIEYSGPFLAIIEIAHFYEAFLVLMIAAYFWATNIWIGLILAALSFIFVIIVDNSFARLTANWMLKFMWTFALGLALTNIIWLYL